MALSCALCASTLTPHPPPRIPLIWGPLIWGREGECNPPPTRPYYSSALGQRPPPQTTDPPLSPPTQAERRRTKARPHRAPNTPSSARSPHPGSPMGGVAAPYAPPNPTPPNGTCTALGPSVARSHVGVWQRCEERSCQAGKADGAPLWGGGGSVGLSGGTWDRSHLNGPIRNGSQRSHCRSRKPQSSRERPQGLHGGRSCSAPHPRPAAHAVAMGAEPGGGPVTAGGGHCGPPTVGVRSLSGAVRRRSSLIESYL